MKSTKIEWCDATVNPVIGCTFGCPFCYAKRMNTRFGWVEDFSNPQFRPKQLKHLYSKKPKRIFMNSMSDVADWKEEWVREVEKAILDNPQHQYLFLTKRPEKLNSECFIDNYNKNIWYGVSVTKKEEISRTDYLPLGYNCFVSIEPLLAPLYLKDERYVFIHDYLSIKWIIIGAETGNRKGKVVPEMMWVDDIVKDVQRHNDYIDRTCLEEMQKYKKYIFMKESLLPTMGEENMMRDFPKELILY